MCKMFCIISLRSLKWLVDVEGIPLCRLHMDVATAELSFELPQFDKKKKS